MGYWFTYGGHSVKMSYSNNTWNNGYSKYVHHGMESGNVMDAQSRNGCHYVHFKTVLWILKEPTYIVDNSVITDWRLLRVVQKIDFPPVPVLFGLGKKFSNSKKKIIEIPLYLWSCVIEALIIKENYKVKIRKTPPFSHNLLFHIFAKKLIIRLLSEVIKFDPHELYLLYP